MGLMASHLLSDGVLASAGHVETVTSGSSSPGSVSATAGASSSEFHMSLFSGSSSSTSGARCALSEKSEPCFCYVLTAGRIWKGDIMVADIEELEKMDASELHAQGLNAKEVLTPMRGDNFMFPVEDGTVKVSGGDQRLRHPP